jgi:hypothetical protein
LQLADAQQQMQRQRDEMRLKIDELNKQHAESLESQHTMIRSNCDLEIDQLQAKFRKEIEQIRRGEHYEF